MACSNTQIVIAFLTVLSMIANCCAEDVVTMQKNSDLILTEQPILGRVIRDVLEDGSGSTDTAEEKDSLTLDLRKHTDIHVFGNDSNPSIALIWSGTKGTLLALTTMTYGLGANVGPSRLYRSINYGRSFVDISKKINNGRIRNSHGLLVSPVNSKHVMLVGDGSSLSSYTYIYVSTDSGEIFNQVRLGFYLDPSSVLFNPHNDLKVLTISGNKFGLELTYDFGFVWTKVSDYVAQARWDPLDPLMFYYLKDPSTKMLKGDFANELYRCGTSPFQCTKIAEHVYSFGIQGDFLFISVEYLTRNGSRVMHVSKDRGKTWDASQIPLINKQQFYSLLDMTEGMVFVHVDSSEGQGDGTIYTSDDKGVIYSKSLEHHLYPNLGSVTDFYKVSSLQGVYITSQLEHGHSTVHSMISFNKGGNWQKIDPPQGSQCDVHTETECRLQIHLLFSKSKGVKLPEFPKSTSSAPGIIMAHANIGDALNFNPPDVYVTSDGGYTWTKALERPHFYAIGDSGGLLYAVVSSEETNKISYSTDEGQTWEKYEFSDSAIVVTGLSVEPGSRSMVLGLWGWNRKGDGSWWSVTVDFKPVLKRACQKEDYVTWTAHEANSMYDEESCLLGAKVSFEKRKKGTMCENGKSYQAPVTHRPCQCQKTDYLCDYGYSRQHLDCVPDSSLQSSSRDICMHDEDEIIKTQGYRKIPGDKCQGGFMPSTEIISLHKSCGKLKPEGEKGDFGVDTDNFELYVPPGSGSVQKSTYVGFIAFLVILVLVLSGVLIFTIRKRRKSAMRVRYARLATSEHATNHDGGTTSLVDETNSYTGNGYQTPAATMQQNDASEISYHDDSDEDMLVS